MTGRKVELLRDLDRDTGRVLMVDGVEQSYFDIVDATHLEFEYMQHMALGIDLVLPPPAAVAAVHLGGGAQTMPRWVADTRPGSRQVVVEKEQAVLDATARLGSVDGARVVVGDALDVVQELPRGSAQLLLWDLYDGPCAVTDALTLEAVRAMRAVLADQGGLIVMNVSDVTPFEVVRPVVAALRAEFADVAVLAEPATVRGRRSGNCVLLEIAPRPAEHAGKLHLDLHVAAEPIRQRLARRAAASPVRGRVIGGADLDGFVDGAQPATADRPLPLPEPSSGRACL